MAYFCPAGVDLAREIGPRGFGLAFGALEVVDDQLCAAALTAGEDPQPPAVVATLLNVAPDGFAPLRQQLPNGTARDRRNG